MVTKLGLFISLWPGFYATATAQDVVDVWTWGNAGVHVELDSAAWTVDAAYLYIRNQNASRFFLRAGSVYVTRQVGKRDWTVGGGYVLGQQDQLGSVHLAQLRLSYNRFHWRLRPNGRLTLDRLWIPARPAEATMASTVNRVRFLAGIEPSLSPIWTLLANTEPFLLRNGLFMREIRSQAGIRWQKLHHLKIELVYFNRWAGFPEATIRW
ncbi:DUF2490 domain-containing protein [Spirosoma arcticum]